MTVQTLMAFAPFAIGAAVLVALLLIPFTRNIILGVFSIIPATALFVIGILASVLWTPTMWLVARVPLLARGGDLFAGGIERLGKRTIGVAAGDRPAIAEEMWPQTRFPFLYSEVPDDIRRPLWEDGKLVGGREIPWMADRHFSAGMTKAAGQLGLAAALIALIVQPLIVVGMMMLAGQAHDAPQVLLEQFPNEAPVYVSGLDVWQTVAASAFGALWHGALTLVGLIAAWLLIAIGIGFMVATAAVEHWRKEASAPYEAISKDSHVRWPYRAEARALAHTGYVRQVAHATGYLQGSPLFKIGEGTGTMRLRGDLAAPTKGQSIALDRESLFQHVLVFGGTGDGKTTAVLKPQRRA